MMLRFDLNGIESELRLLKCKNSKIKYKRVHRRLSYIMIMIGLPVRVFARQTGVQSQVESYQRLKKWYLLPPCLTLSIIRYESRVKWNNPGKGVAPFHTRWCNSYWKGSLRVTLDYGRQLYFTNNNDTVSTSRLQWWIID